MRKTARPYFAAVVLGALLVPTAPLVTPAVARPPVPFLLAVQVDTPADDAFAALRSYLVPRTRPAVQNTSAPQAAVRVEASPPKTSVHVVAAGDTLWSLARQYGTSVSALAQMNGVSETATLRLGQRLAVAASAVGSAPRAAATRPAARPPFSHTVVFGDTLWSLARRYGTSVGVLAQMNGVSETATLRLGQRLAVQPSAAGASPARVSTRGESQTIVVRSGQTLSQIADTYGVSTRTLVEANGLASAHAIRAGQRLTIPGRTAASGTAARAAPRVQVPQNTRPLAGALQRGFFTWPARGVLTSRFGVRWRRHHNGIDIAAPRGTPIYAGRGGLVSFAGWYYGYGLAVMIDHGAGIISIYGHASKLLVRGGQAVSAGQIIARVGCTGSCTGSHVHFEVRVNGRPLNPLRYL